MLSFAPDTEADSKLIPLALNSDKGAFKAAKGKAAADAHLAARSAMADKFFSSIRNTRAHKAGKLTVTKASNVVVVTLNSHWEEKQ